jgi:hypothetical protein
MKKFLQELAGKRQAPFAAVEAQELGAFWQ